MTDYVGIAAIIAAVGGTVTPVLLVIITQRQNRKIEQVHQATNGMSQKLQDFAEARGEVKGEAAGKAKEKANPS